MTTLNEQAVELHRAAPAILGRRLLVQEGQSDNYDLYFIPDSFGEPAGLNIRGILRVYGYLKGPYDDDFYWTYFNSTNFHWRYVEDQE